MSSDDKMEIDEKKPAEDDAATEAAEDKADDAKKEEPKEDGAEKPPATAVKEEEADPPPEEKQPELAPAPAPASKPSKKRPRSPDTEGGASTTSQQQQAAVSAASAAAAAQLSATMGWNGLYSLLSAAVTTNTSTSSSSNNLPTVEQVHQAATKSVQECPPFCHLSKTDSAPQLKVSLEERRLLAKGGMRGFRMARATHGVSSGNYYYEALIMEPPPVSEIVSSLPPNIRMGKKLQDQMQQALLEEQEGLPKTSTFGGHVRLGWSMRTGDLQAPVGYDKWSFGLRDIAGSKIHCSKREDHWGGEPFGPGDVVGCAISLPPKDADNNDGNSNVNHIRFFKNGMPMGQFVISKGKREGGAAFSPIPDGVYYPAISLYMAAVVKINPGPHFVYQPRKLPAGLKFQPFSDLCKQPISVDDAVTKVQKEKTFRKADMLQKFQELVQTEVQVLQDSYQNHRKKHVQEVFKEREKRNLSTNDLEDDEFFEKASPGN